MFRTCSNHDPMTSTVPPAARIFSVALCEKRCADTVSALSSVPSPRILIAAAELHQPRLG